MTNSLSYAALMLAAGIGIPVMASMNVRLGIGFGSLSVAVMLLLIVAFAIMTISMMFTGFPRISMPDLPIYYYLAGVLFVFYIISISWVAPNFGIGNAVFFVLLGQLIASAAIDHFGLFGMTSTPIDKRRIIGLLLMVFSVFLYVKR